MPAKPRILICEDNEGINDVMQLVLEQDYAVTTLVTGEGILETVEELQPAVILLDLWLPGMSGEEIAKKLKSQPHTKNIPIIIVSASRDALKVAEAVGADAALQKPFDIAELEALVKKFVA